MAGLKPDDTQFILGVVAGLLLSTVLRIGSVAPSGGGTQMHFQGAALALMGGFSSGVVQRIVQRLIETLDSMLRGGAAQEMAARDAAQKQELEDMIAKDRVRTALLLADMQRRLAAGASPEEVGAMAGQAGRAALGDDRGNQRPM